MAAPPEKTLRDLTGKWTINKNLSINGVEFATMQGVPWVIRKAISVITLTFTLTSSTTSTGHSTLTIVGMQGNTETLIVDGEWRKADVKALGEIDACASWVKLEELDNEWLKNGWAEEENKGIKFESKSEKKGWEACAVWGFQNFEGQRRLARHMTITDGKKTVQAMAVYDFAG